MKGKILLLFLLPLALAATPQKSQKAATKASNWHRMMVKDEMTDEKSLLFYTSSAMGSDKSALLSVVCRQDGGVRAHIIFQHVVIEEPYEGMLTARFDQDRSGTSPWERGADYKTLVSTDPRQLIKYLMDSSTFRIEVTEYPGTVRLLTFKVGGLDRLMKGHCGL